MAVNFASVPVTTWKGGALVARSIKLAAVPRMAPKQISVPIVWSDYGAGLARPFVGVSVNVAGGVQINLLDEIRGIYIDNVGSYVAVYVHFPGDGFTATCPPFSSVFVPCLTSNQECIIFASGFTDQTPVPRTTVRLLNIPVNPFQDNEIASVQALQWANPIIGSTGNLFSQARLGLPALGDAVFPLALTMTAQGQGVVLDQNSPLRVGAPFWVINSIVLQCSNVTAPGTNIEGIFEFTNGTDILYSWRAGFPMGYTGFLPVFRQENMHIKIDAADNWVLTNQVGSFTTGTVLIYAVATPTPQ